MPASLIKKFIKLESAGGILLLGAAMLALIINNSPLEPVYNLFLSTPVAIQVGALQLHKPLVLWVNDGLMAIFFLLVGLEIKREVIIGELNTLKKSALPCIGALGGMAIPALIYFLFNFHSTVALTGWAIPTATDIAFALGILSILGSRIPTSMKMFLMALAILDDLGAIVIIAIFYTAQLSFLSLGLAVICLSILIMLNRFGVTRLAPYVITGIILWVCVLKSGVHATLAGVALALAIPLQAKDSHGRSPARWVEESLIPWVAFGVLPLFAFVNAGVSFKGMTFETITHPIPMGIALGLFAGKQIGVFGASWLAVKTRLASLPTDVNWYGMYGVALLCGVGFTMSLFIGGLAFDEIGGQYPKLVRLGVLFGSTCSGIMGYLLLRFFCPMRTNDAE